MPVNKRFDQFDPGAALEPDFLIAIENIKTKILEYFPVALFTPNVTPDTEQYKWQSDTPYLTGAAKIYGGQWWLALQNVPANLVPGTNPAYWEPVGQSASGLVFWTAGVFIATNTFVLYDRNQNPADMKIQFFWLKNPTRPYVSTDFEAELLAGDWVQLFVDATGGITLGDLFPNTFFCAPAPIGNDATGAPGDFSKPYTPAGAVAAASAGDMVTFLPGYYNVASNLQKDGIAYTTFGGSVVIEITTPGVCAFDYSGSNSDLPVFFSGSFRALVNAPGASFFKGNDAVAVERSHVIEFSLIDCIDGAYGIVLPRFSTASRISGQINAWAGFTGYAISTPLTVNSATAKGGTLNLNIYNETSVPAFENFYFTGYIVNLNYNATSTGGLSFTFGIITGCVWTLNIKQPAGTLSRMPSGGTFNVSLEGGEFDWRGSAKIQVDGSFKNANLIFNLTDGVYLSGRIDTCFVQLSQVTDRLFISAVSDNCTLFGQNITIDGYHTNMDFLIDRVGVFKIPGTVILKANELLSFDGNARLEISGKVIGDNVNGILRFLTAAGNKCRISGQVKNRAVAGPAIVCQNGADIPTLILRGATIEVEATATDSIQVTAGSTLNMKMLGDSYSNVGLGGAGAFTYDVGSAANYIDDPDVEVMDF